GDDVAEVAAVALRRGIVRGAVRGPVRVEVIAGRGGVGRAAVARRVNVEAVLARREAAHGALDADAVADLHEADETGRVVTLGGEDLRFRRLGLHARLAFRRGLHRAGRGAGIAGARPVFCSLPGLVGGRLRAAVRARLTRGLAGRQCESQEGYGQ